MKAPLTSTRLERRMDGAQQPGCRGILVYGGLGYLIGLYFGKSQVGLAIGAVFGLAASTVLVFYRLRHLDSGSQPQREA